MTDLPATTHARPKSGRAIAVLAGLVVFAAIAVLVLNVQREIRTLSSARSDNVQWALAQAEVEFLEYTRQTNSYPIDVTALRRRFDVFYSRMSTIRDAGVFEDLRATPETAALIEEIWVFLEASVEIIDRDDLVVVARLPELNVLNQEARPKVRLLAKSGLSVFAERSDAQRAAVARTMTQLAAALAALIGALGLGLYYLNNLNTRSIGRERARALASARMHTVIDTSLDAVIVSDQDGAILEFNPAAETIFGHKAEDVIGAQIGDVIVPDHMRTAHEAGMDRMRKGGARRVVGKGRVQLEGKRANGDNFPVELALQSAKTEDGEIIIAYLRDISKRVSDQEELVRARDAALAGEKLKADFLATMSHEIRTPLNGLLGNLNLLRDTRLNKSQDKYVGYMESSGRLLMSQISDVLDITRYDAGKLTTKREPVNVSALIKDIIDNQSGMAVENETALSWGWDGEPMNWIQSDHDRLQHILMNLIGNAVKFTRRGKVSVTVAAQEVDGEDRLSIRVTDTGVGIPEEMIGQVFDDFVTGSNAPDRNAGGTGLGLSIAKRFVEALGGQIGVESTLEEGSTFWVDLPVTEAEAPTQTAKVGDPNLTQAALSILLVEDNEINRIVAREMIEADGHSVVEAHDGQQAVEIARQQPFDLILMDINMPVMDGRAATRSIRQGGGLNDQTIILALTANAIASEQDELIEDGMNGILTKPLSRSALRAVLADPSGQISDVSNPVLVDAEHSAETRAALGEQAFAKLKARFAQEVDALIEWLSSDDARDMLEIGSRCHKLAGSTAVFGAFGLRDHLRGIERAAKAGDSKLVLSEINRLPSLWKATKQQL